MLKFLDGRTDRVITIGHLPSDRALNILSIVIHPSYSLQVYKVIQESRAGTV